MKWTIINCVSCILEVLGKSPFVFSWLNLCYGRVTTCLPVSVFAHGDLSRRLQPGYNYVGKTNARQPLHIKCCGQVAWFNSWPQGGGGGRGTAPPPHPLSPQSATDRVAWNPTHPPYGWRRPPTDPGWDTAVTDSGPTRPPSFPAPLTLSAGRPAVRIVPYTFSYRASHYYHSRSVARRHPDHSCDGSA